MFKPAKLLLILLSVLIALIPAGELEAKKKKDNDKKKENGKAFEEVIKDYKKIDGFFTFYTKADEGKVYMEIKPDQFEQTYMCNITRSAGDGTYYDNGADIGEFPFEFKRIGKNIHMIQKNLRFRADTSSTLSRAIERGVSNSIFGIAKIESEPEKETKTVLVDPSAFFIQDISNISYYLGKKGKLEYTFDKDNSYFGEIKSFPLNSEIDAVYHFETKKPNDAQTFPSSYSMLHTYHFSLSALIDTGYKPRFADDRIGYFQTLYQDYNQLDKETPYVRYINRWHLEKAYPDSALSKPVKPIVYWLGNTIPEEYRPYVRKGVLLWNKAFEKIGFKDAIVVKQMSDTASWDPADARYSTIQWVVFPGRSYAVGPSHTNPYTGQIYDADVRICVDFIRWMYIKSEYYIDPLVSETAEPDFYNDGIFSNHRRCNYAQESAKDASFAMNILNARSDFDDENETTKEFVQAYIVDLVVHEVGHTLGLRHNFKASTINTNEQRHDKTRTQKLGVTGSVMDYNPANIAPEGTKQGEFFHSIPGTYDFWAIEYGYKPIDAATPEDELPELEKIASRCTDPLLIYATDEDVFGNSMTSIDPLCNMFDLSSDPMAYLLDEISLSTELWDKIEEKFENPGNRYQKMLTAFNRGWSPYYYIARLIPKFIGGIYHNNYHVGDSENTLPFEPVPASKQKEAMQFLKEHLFAPDVFSFPASLLNKLQPERLEDFKWSAGKIKRLDYPIHDRVFSCQKIAIDRLYNPIALSRLQDIVLHYEKGQEIYTMTDMFTDLRRAVWSPEIVSGKNINSFRRRLQRYHLDKAIGMVLQKQAGIPEDARTLARNDLKILQRAIAKAITVPTLDIITKAHLEESKARIDAALKAGIDRNIGVVKK
ncbi:MAG: zinc-dependent metalloprotease [candidate division Zixibacteria bacterium]|nr:zinc-dependent metalloprotease [candidate division Zixibacteria bacterium]